MMAILYLKALHIVFVVSWFCGLFYIVRLFVYHTEAMTFDEPKQTILHEEYIKNERLLWRIITTPAMVLTLITGISMLVVNPGYLQGTWMHVKLTLVFGLLLYHFKCGQMIKQLALKKSTWTSFQLRLWNEVATLFLVSIVFIVVLKNSINWIWGTAGFMLFAIIIMMIVKIVKQIRLKN
ncbi:MAG: CopD family protein [Chitinophagales bacterium]